MTAAISLVAAHARPGVLRWARHYAPPSSQQLRRERQLDFLKLMLTVGLGSVALVMVASLHTPTAWQGLMSILKDALFVAIVVVGLRVWSLGRETRFEDANVHTLEALAEIRDIPEIAQVLRRIAAQGRPITRFEAHQLLDVACTLALEHRMARLRRLLLGSGDDLGQSGKLAAPGSTSAQP